MPALIHWQELVALNIAKEDKFCKEVQAIVNHPKVRNCILQILRSDIMNAVNTIRNILRQDEAYEPINTPTQIFEWSMVHFKKRMDPNATYIDVLHLEPPRKLGIVKMLTDLENLEWHLNLMFSDVDQSVNMTLLSLKGCRKLLTVRDEIEAQYDKNSKLVVDLKSDIGNFYNREKLGMRMQSDRVNNVLDRCKVEALVSDPLYTRFICNVQRVHFDSLEDQYVEQERSLTQRNENYRANIDRNNQVFERVMMYYTNMVDIYKSQISYWSWKYEEDFNEIENDVAYRQMTLKVLHKQWQDCIDRLGQYRESIWRVTEEQQKEQPRALSKQQSLVKTKSLKNRKNMQNRAGKREK